MKKLSFQKIFCFISFIFIFSCCVFYGTRFIKLYLETKKEESIEKNSLAKVIRENNLENDNFKDINGNEYFINDSTNNYLIYSNILWRIIRVNEDNSITVISDSSISNLAYGKDLTYETSHINKWLNNNDEDYSGILENNLNNINTYLQKTTTCLDIIDKIDNQECQNTNLNNYISLLSSTDYANTGKESFIINGQDFYLNNTNSQNEVWYITNDGKLKTSNGNDIIGIRPVITIKSNIDFLAGNGSKENPYTIENENGLFGSYVKLDNDIWRIYQTNENEVRLMLNDYLKVNNTELTYQYSNKNSYYDDYVTKSLGYYLNNTFLSNLSYKDQIKEVYWPNGVYNDDSNYDYTKSLDTEINTKVALMSIGNIFLNSELTNYHTMTQLDSNGNYIYTIQANKSYTKQIYQEIFVVPTISIEKNLLTKGNGTIDSPYEME